MAEETQNQQDWQQEDQKQYKNEKQGDQKWIIIGAIVGVLLVGYLIAANANSWWPFSGDAEIVTDDDTSADRPQSGNEEVCIQVTTQAKHPETDEVKEFATPCDVPADWIIINPEEVGYDVINTLGLKAEDVFEDEIASDNKEDEEVAGKTTSPRTGMGEWFLFSISGLVTFAIWYFKKKRLDPAEK